MSSIARQRRRGTAAQHETFTGLNAELTVDITDYRVVVHDGVTAGGHPMAKLSEVEGFATAEDAALTGTPTAPTAAQGTNTTQIATTAFVRTEVAALADSAPAALDTLNELAAALGDDPNFATTVTNSLAAKAPLASPALTGNPTAPTQATSDNSTRVATTAYVKAAIADSSVTGLSALQSNMALAAMKIADLEGVRLNMAGGIADAYDSETDVDTATSTNESYDSTDDLYSPSVTAGSAISGATGTNIGNATGNGGLAAAFNGVTSATNANCAVLSATSCYVGKTYSPARPVGQVIVYGSNNFGYINGNDTITISLYGKTGSAPANDTDGTLLGTTSFADTTDESGNPRTVTSSNTTTSWDHVWVRVSLAGGATSILIAEVTFYDPGTTNNMTLVSNAFTASAVPTQARVAVFIDPQESITINTDFTAEVSRDGGTTWTAVTLALVSNPVGTVEQYEGTVSISSQPSGSSMKYRLKTLNNKDIDVTGIVFQWS